MDKINSLLAECRVGYKKQRRRPPNIKGVELTAKEAIAAILAIGKLLVPGFKIDDANKDLYNKLIYYAMLDANFNTGQYKITHKVNGIERVGYYDYSLEKGILICGPKGTGKTDAMRVFGEFCRVFNTGITLEFVRMGDVENKFKEKGYEVLRFNNAKNNFLDELGQENEKSNRYNDSVNVATVILQDKYNQWKFNGVLSFGTSNSTGELLYNQYGEIVYDRICEMFNIIYLTGETRRPQKIVRL